MKKEIYFITGNKNKAEYFKKILNLNISHKKIELEEIQSLNLEEIVRKKVHEAYRQLKKPIIVEDVSLEFSGLNDLPGPFIKFFTEKLTLQEISDLVKNKNKNITAKTTIGYYDGTIEKYFTGILKGNISPTPKGENGFGWDKIFIPKNYPDKTRGELTDLEYKKTYLKQKPYDKLKDFLIENNLI